ncbi:alpha/beta hydrolase [Aeromonas taiwanensis]|uniref:Alpha/beta hydrolase n=1 Tax=Aeromonas taiwanensis TaxID=633417 RepID=A0A5F0KAP7_9GAMM|nr:alpha/beta hydrolase [Aeromonas taiwanensis]TFF75732.1 alpha/beta hydrolase [Aeromonas taiwanensis]TFF76747.1 alpha/beta hydrolase [Aeromonas taiwanensis]TFF80194.1 alpha/beta hydrolase [Aeromonas taiwanensis]
MMEERVITLADGRRVALLDNGRQGRPLLVALHGWLDNGASFLPLAPHLEAFHLVCLDLPGHGHSDHKHTPYVFVDWLDDLHQIVQAAGWTRFTLLGHSLGALIASAYAGVFPEQVERLILMEGLGPLSQPDEEVPGQLRRAILNRSRTRERAASGFASLEEAVAARCKVADISPAAARLICERQLEARAGRWYWRSDPRLRDLSPLRMSEGQAQALIRAIACPVLFIRGEEGFPWLLEQWRQRAGAFAQIEMVQVAGNHHFHMDNSSETAVYIEKFGQIR